jgi:hypothetical protein
LAQDREEPRTLFGEADITGGFIGVAPKFTNVLGDYALLTNVSGGIILNDRWNIGATFAVSGTVIKNPLYEELLRTRSTAVLDGLEFRYGYAGLLVEPVLQPRSVVHLKLPVAIGFGWASYSYPTGNGNSSDNGTQRRTRTDGQSFVVIEPGAELEVSIVKAFRLGVGGSYIYTTDLELPATPKDALRNVTARCSLTFVFGSSSEVRN